RGVETSTVWLVSPLNRSFNPPHFGRGVETALGNALIPAIAELSTRPTSGGVLKLRPTKPLSRDTSNGDFGKGV
ncbi:MAG TPA: hypothetical protein VE956_19545, partial [Nodularia sp. (in: cyanobacteria)]|nr:hypothetical protein [Nodularia sp. (in: cyanobacteria)]